MQSPPKGCCGRCFCAFRQDAGAPASVIAFREALKKADAFVFATCEYNFSLSAAMKNALDWGSRGDGGNLFDDKPAAVVSAGGGTGGLRAQQHIRDIALFLNLHFMNKAEVCSALRRMQRLQSVETRRMMRC